MVTDSAVLQEHTIHPAVVQVKLQGNRSGGQLPNKEC